MNLMTKRGNLDNVVLYEHYCDGKSDLNNIPLDQINLGSIALVLKDENDSIGFYMADSNKEWHAISFLNGGGGSGGDDSGDDSQGSDETMVVNFTETSATSATCDKTYAEVLSQLTNGKFVYGIIDLSYTSPLSQTYYLYVAHVAPIIPWGSKDSSAVNAIVFSGNNCGSSYSPQRGASPYPNTLYVALYEDNTVQHYTQQL